MKHRWSNVALLAGLVAVGLSACGGSANTAAPAASTGVAIPTLAAAPTTAAISGLDLSAEQPQLELGVSGVGEVKAARDADLVFAVQGTVAQVLVEEGAVVKQGDLLAVLDTRTFDQQINQTEAALASAEAAQAGLTEPGRASDVNAARAQLASAQASLEQVRAGAKPQDRQAAEAALGAAEANLQATRDRLSLAKTQADIQLQQSVQVLTQAQARYAQAKGYWEHARDNGTDPVVPEVAAGNQRVPNTLSDGQRENYYQQFVSAEAALRQAEQSVELAKAAFDTARQSEITGIAAAEQQAVQARASLDKLKAGADKSQVAAAQAGVAQAQAALTRASKPDPSNAQEAQAAAGVAQAKAALELARINRERAELRAPFDGVIATVTIDPGDPSATGAQPAVRIVDVSKLEVDVQISDVDIARVKEGQKAEVRADALPDKVFTGKVSYIAPTATAAGTLRTYVVRVQLDSQDGLRAGMSVRVDLPEDKAK
ncbi:MAG: efflux RND transporter periplasmic adaptor subunit [Roseiflexaceae bacterium]